jgi:hypothetical protein
LETSSPSSQKDLPLAKFQTAPDFRNFFERPFFKCWANLRLKSLYAAILKKMVVRQPGTSPRRSRRA